MYERQIHYLTLSKQDHSRLGQAKARHRQSVCKERKRMAAKTRSSRRFSIRFQVLVARFWIHYFQFACFDCVLLPAVGERG